MARLPRLTLAGQPHHVIQRGNNRQAVFLDRADREMFLGLLGENAARFGIALHAYVLMDNHFHLLATPSTADGLPQWMQAVGRRYVRYFNDRHGRSGTLWEGRYKSTLIQTERYLLACMAYMDLNPVRAGMVAEAREHPWSSHGHYAGLVHDRLLTPHPLYWTLSSSKSISIRAAQSASVSLRNSHWHSCMRPSSIGVKQLMMMWRMPEGYSMSSRREKGRK